MAYSHGWLDDTGYGQKTLVPHHVDISVRLLERPYEMAAGFPQCDMRKSKTEVAWLLIPSLRSHTMLFLQYSIGQAQFNLIQCEWILCKAMNTRKQGSLWATLETGYHRWHIGIGCYLCFSICLFELPHSMVTKYQEKEEARKPVGRKWHNGCVNFGVCTQKFVPHHLCIILPIKAVIYPTQNIQQEECLRFCGHL